MEDETLSNILNLLQNTNTSTSTSTSKPTANSSSTINNEVQTMLLKFLLSGGLNQFMNFNKNNPTETTTISDKPRTIDLKNYQRLD